VESDSWIRLAAVETTEFTGLTCEGGNAVACRSICIRQDCSRSETKSHADSPSNQRFQLTRQAARLHC
jgi:hypothetical protein